MKRWRFLDIEYPDAKTNLALEEAIAREVGAERSPPTFRLWRNRRAAVIGENQAAKQELQLEACRELDVEVARRFTGGGAVYHDLGNLNYTICTQKFPASDLRSQQMFLGRALDCAVIAIGNLGLKTEIAPINSVVSNGHKISGGSAAVRWGTIFYHGSILINSDLETMWRVLRQDQHPKHTRFVQSRHAPVTSLERVLGREVPMDEAKKAMKRAFCDMFVASLSGESATERELFSTDTLLKEKYSRNEWTLKL